MSQVRILPQSHYKVVINLFTVYYDFFVATIVATSFSVLCFNLALFALNLNYNNRNASVDSDNIYFQNISTNIK